MKILIAYDGSEGSKYALEDIEFAGLPSAGVEARLISVGEFIFPADEMFFADAKMPLCNLYIRAIAGSEYACHAIGGVSGERREKTPTGEIAPTGRLKRGPD